MEPTTYPYTKKFLLIGSLIAGIWLVWAFVIWPWLRQSEPQTISDSPAAILDTPPARASDPAPSGEGIVPEEAIGPNEAAVFPNTARAAGLRREFPSRTLLAPIQAPRPTVTIEPLWHTVQAGEILLVIAAQYGTTVEEIMVANTNLDPTRLQIGQQLYIPVTVTPIPTIAATPTPTVPAEPTPTPINYTIRAGDILLNIADEYSTTVEAIMIANEIIDPRSLQVGQVLLIPPDKGSILGVPTVVHEITAGDTLLGLATRYGSTLEDIEATNPDLEPTSLQIGQKIIVPLTQRQINPEADPLKPRLTSAAPVPAPLLALEQEIARAINLQRQIQNLPDYTLDESLAEVAQIHAQDMVARGYFSHVTPEGVTARGRTEGHGLALNWVGENIQRNTQPFNQTTQYAVDWFMSSRPHRTNILHDKFDRLGVGVAEGPTGWYTFVLVFGGD